MEFIDDLYRLCSTRHFFRGHSFVFYLKHLMGKSLNLEISKTWSTIFPSLSFLLNIGVLVRCLIFMFIVGSSGVRVNKQTLISVFIVGSSGVRVNKQTLISMFIVGSSGVRVNKQTLISMFVVGSSGVRVNKQMIK